MDYKIHNSREIYRGFFNVREIDLQFEHFEGGYSDQVTRIILYKNEAVSALVYIEDEDVFLLIRQFRLATTEQLNGWIIESVAGGIEEGESPEEAISREVEEEVGYQVSDLNKIAGFYVSPGITNEFIHLYLAKTNSSLKLSDPVSGDHEENIEVIRIPRIELYEWLRLNPIVDAKTIIALQYVLTSGTK